MKPISLPSASESKLPLAGKIAETAGWGQISPDDKRPASRLRFIQQPIISTEKCKEYSSYVYDTNICISTTHRDSACYGSYIKVIFHGVIYSMILFRPLEFNNTFPVKPP
jgi:hypothetical protein